MMIETAIALPTFMLLLLGIFLFAMALVCYCSATYASRVGARYASLHSALSRSPASASDVSTLVSSQLFMPGATSTSVTVSYSNAAGGSSPANLVGSQVIVLVTWNQALQLPGYSNVLALRSQAYRVITR